MKTKIMGILTMLCSLLGCNAQTEGFKSLTVEEYAKAIEDTTILRLDVRTAEEYANGHIANTTNIDILQEGFIEKVKAHISSLPIKGESEGILIAVNCRSGKRSKKASTLLVNHGYKVIELDAGYNDWLSKGMPVTKD